MNKMLATLIVNNKDDYNNSIIKALQKDGYTIVQTEAGMSENEYIIAIEVEDNDDSN